ncbi:Metallo-dependent phosphatase-like protein [Mycena olivaceomarginata]|nr:Metallo-dependent phosphatase-like protein [Mycena olivaceomarginata]
MLWVTGTYTTTQSRGLGDFASFVSRMKELAIKKDVDLLLVDSGDLHDGTGLSDGYPVGGVDAQQSNEFFKQLPYDVLAIGRHSLFPFFRKLKSYQNFAPHFEGRYLSSNVNITINGVSKPTRKGRAVTALGVLFDFKGNAANTTVQKVEDMVKEAWFVDAIKDEPDLFLLAGHMPGRLSSNAIRAVHPLTPILILGGHTHIRDCLQLDGRSMSLESGRYMETIGWMSADLPEPKGHHGGCGPAGTSIPTAFTFEYHARARQLLSFDTTRGVAITKGLEQLAKEFDLGFTYGTAPHDFTIISAAPYPANNSLLSLMSEVMPVALTVNNTRASRCGSTSMRGPFTKNDQLTVLSYADPFLYIPNVPFSVAKGVLPALNGAGTNHRRRDEAVEAELWARGYAGTRYREWMEDMVRRNSELDGQARFAVAKLTPGYFYSLPNFIASAAPIGFAVDAPIDLVFVDFLEKQLIGILNGLQKDKVYTTADVSKYTNVLATEALGIYAQQKWN